VRVCLCPGWTLGAVLYENSQLQYDCEYADAAVAADDDNDDDAAARDMLSRLLIFTNQRQ